MGTPAEIAKAVDMLMKARRPRARLHSPSITPKSYRSARSSNFTVMAQDGDDKAGEYLLEHYHVERAFECINKTSELSLEQKAGLNSRI